MTTQEKLEALFAEVCAQRAILEPALEEVKRGENLIDIEELNLRKPWA